MRRVGLALSGGGFRATLYHLGVVRYLRDAGILPKVSHITSVSGGSILGAHLALNWDRYCGSAAEFDQAAQEVIRFVQLDVRNRIVRRFPMASAINTGRRWLRLGTRRELTRSGLLEQYYKNHLYGDVGLSQLPSHPQLHMLATNLSEGCLCSFSSQGLILQRRTAGQRDRYEKVDIGLATVAMAVTASSAFPGFFPPLELNGWDVGADVGEFTTQAFTDGGVYDNLGLRMFRCIEQSWVQAVAPLRAADFVALEDTTTALLSADSLPENAPLRRIRERLDKYAPRFGDADTSAERAQELVIRGLWEIIRTEKLYRDPSFQGMELIDKSADSLIQYVRSSGRDPELSDQLWLNRQVIASSLQQAVGQPCMQVGRHGFDAIMVSDAGGKFKVNSDGRAGGLVKTALRSSDILMDRVWQLELEASANTPGVFFFPITQMVDAVQDRTAPHLEVQRQAARIRTDLDRFSDLEVSALVQHGYCVARTHCREIPNLNKQVPKDPPWDPCSSTDGDHANSPGPSLRDGAQGLDTARELRYSSLRRTWSTLFDLGDWPSYVWLLVLLIACLSVPYLLYKQNQRAQRHQMVLEAVSGTSPVYSKLLDMLQTTTQTSIDSMEFTEVDSTEPLDFSGFEVLSDIRIYDLRSWSAAQSDDSAPPRIYSYVRSTVRRLPTAEPDLTNFRLHVQTADDLPQLRCKTTGLRPRLLRVRQPLPDGMRLWELNLDFSHVPLGSSEEVVLEGFAASESAELMGDSGRFRFAVPSETGVIQVWMLMPHGRNYEYFEITGHPIGQPGASTVFVPTSQVELPFGSIATFKLINPRFNYRYECRWKWSSSTP